MRRKIHVFALAATMLPIAGCKPPKKSGAEVKIYGGTEVQSSEFEFRATVALLDAARSPFCTGTLVAPNVVVTAAHCFSDGNTAGTLVSFGADAARGQSFPATLARFYEGYDAAAAEGPADTAQIGDIAVVVFNGAAPQGFAPAAILDPTVPLGNIQVFTLAGYGNREGGAFGQLYKASSNLTREMRTAREFELGGTRGNTCQGDSGGPVYATIGAERFLIGATSRGPECESGSGIYTDVRQYVAWLQTTAGVKLPVRAPGQAHPAPAPPRATPAAPAPAIASQKRSGTAPTAPAANAGTPLPPTPSTPAQTKPAGGTGQLGSLVRQVLGGIGGGGGGGVDEGGGGGDDE